MKNKNIFLYSFIIGAILIILGFIELFIGHPIQFLIRFCDNPFPQVSIAKIIQGFGLLVASFFPMPSRKSDTSTGFIGSILMLAIGILIFIVGIIWYLWGWNSYIC